MNVSKSKWELFNSLPEGVILFDTNQKIVFLNEEAQSIMSKGGRPLMGKVLMDIWPKENQGKLKGILEKTIQTKAHHLYSDLLPGNFDGPNSFVICCAPLDGNYLLRLRKTIKEEAEHNHMQRSLEELSAYKLALEESTILAITDLKGNITYANDNFCRISKYKREELIGQPHSIINSGYHSKAFFKDMWQTIGKGKIWKGQFKNKAKDGTEYWVNTSIVPFLNQKGRPYQYLAIREDITEKKNIELELVKTNRLYQFTSAINRSIVHIKDKNQLIERLCEVSIEIGKFNLTWIHLIEKDFVFLHSAQGDQGKISRLLNLNRMSVHHKGLHGSIVEMAIQTRLPQHFESFSQLGSLAKAYFKTIDEDYPSKLVFPFVVANQVVGLWFVVSEETDVFDHAEKYLLEEASMDISYAFENIDTSRQKDQFESNLLKNEKRFRFITEKSKDIKLIADKDGKIIYVSPSVTAYLGYPVESLIGEVGQKIVHPLDLPTYIEARSRILETPGATYNLVIRLRHQLGHYVWIECTTTNWLEEPGIHGLVSNFFDITEKKLIEEARIKDEMNLKALINNTSDLIWSIDKDFKLITCNLAYKNIVWVQLGKDINPGDNILEYPLDPALLDSYKARFLRSLGGESFTDIVHFNLPMEFWLEISFYPIVHKSEIVGVSCFAKDVTEKRLKEEKLKASEARLMEAQSIAHMGNWEFDLEKQVSVWSPEACRIFGIDTMESLQSFESWLSFIHPADRTFVNSHVTNQQEKLLNDAYDYRILRRDGTMRYIHTESKFKFDHKGNPIGLFGILVDITERKETELLLENTLAQLEERIEERTKEISQKNSNILDSINYAKRIQLGMLANDGQLKEIFNSSFVVNMPRDIVSGDFFWCYQRRNKKYIIVSDCTGHGVPGALMSIIGTNLLNQIIINEHYENPSEILEILDSRIKQAVQANDSEVKDGMDLSLCIVDYYFNELFFAGANNPVFLSKSNGNVELLKADRIAIGGAHSEESKRFETKRFSFEKGQRLYLSTDGYPSQFGGPFGKKYMKERFRCFLESINLHPIESQKGFLLNEFNAWKGDTEQVDDILVIGLEL
jgi:PAS domain S-box-containing protein